MKDKQTIEQFTNDSFLRNKAIDKYKSVKEIKFPDDQSLEKEINHLQKILSKCFYLFSSDDQINMKEKIFRTNLLKTQMNSDDSSFFKTNNNFETLNVIFDQLISDNNYLKNQNQTLQNQINEKETQIIQFKEAFEKFKILQLHKSNEYISVDKENNKNESNNNNNFQNVLKSLQIEQLNKKKLMEQNKEQKIKIELLESQFTEMIEENKTLLLSENILKDKIRSEQQEIYFLKKEQQELKQTNMKLNNLIENNKKTPDLFNTINESKELIKKLKKELKNKNDLINDSTVQSEHQINNHTNSKFDSEKKGLKDLIETLKEETVTLKEEIVYLKDNLEIERNKQKVTQFIPEQEIQQKRKQPNVKNKIIEEMLKTQLNESNNQVKRVESENQIIKNTNINLKLEIESLKRQIKLLE